MKKRQFLLTAILIGAMAVAAGCSSKNNEEAALPAQTETTQTEAEQTEAAQEEGTLETEKPVETEASGVKEQSTLTGVIDEIKDFMFVVIDDNDTPYALSFGDEKPEGLDEVKVGDRVVVTYTGELSSVDPFTGEIISIKKAE